MIPNHRFQTCLAVFNETDPKNLFFFLYLSFLFAVNNLAEFDMIHKIQNLSLHSNINKIYMYIFINRI